MRLLLPYITVIHMLNICMKYFSDYSINDVPSMDHINCNGNMWKNLVFLDNFSPYNERVYNNHLIK